MEKFFFEGFKKPEKKALENKEELKMEEKEKEITPEYLETVSQEVKKEGAVLSRGIDRFPKIKKTVAAAMLLTTLWGAGLAKTAEAGDKSYLVRSTERSAAKVIDGAARGASRNLENVFERFGFGLTPREQARLVERKMKIEERRILQEQREQERIRMQEKRALDQRMRELALETERKQQSYERQKQKTFDDYRQALSKAKTAEEIELAKKKYEMAIEALDESYGIKKTETKETAVESQKNQGNDSEKKGSFLPPDASGREPASAPEEKPKNEGPKEPSEEKNPSLEEKTKSKNSSSKSWNLARENVKYEDEYLGKKY